MLLLGTVIEGIAAFEILLLIDEDELVDNVGNILGTEVIDEVVDDELVVIMVALV